MPRRRSGVLLPLEVDILAAGMDMQADEGGFYGFGVARAIAEGGQRGLTAHGTLYKALARMADRGLLESEWEAPERAELEGRPRRRLYRVTAAGAAALRAHRAAAETSAATAARLGLA
ncbi:PadR family transcriptional regulator [Agromyces soli]